MKNYNEMSCGELRRQLNQIDNDLRCFSSMSQVKKDRLIYERMKINNILLHKIIEILNENEKEA